MSDSNRVRLAYLEDAPANLGVINAVAQAGTAQSTYRTMRYTGESLAYNITNVSSAEMQPDRNVRDVIQAAASNAGDIMFELSFPQTRTHMGDHIAASMSSDWLNTPEFYSLTVGGQVTAAGVTAGTYGVAAGGGAVIPGHLVLASGFNNPANNALGLVTASTATTIVTNTALATEAAPPAGARIKVVGLQGAIGDIAATASGLTSTIMNFVAAGILVGQWINIGGLTPGTAFATAANNDFARVALVSANVIILDNLPLGWAADSGAGQTIRLWLSDVLRNGTVRRSFAIEKGFMDQTPPGYAVFLGQTAGQLQLTLQSGQVVKGQITYMGQTHRTGLAPIGASPALPTLLIPLNSVSNVGRISEGGLRATTPNFVKQLTLTVNNNLREKTALGILGLADVGLGTAEVKGSVQVYFGSQALYAKYVAGAVSSVSFSLLANGQGVVTSMPRVKYETGKITAQGANQDVMADMSFPAIWDPATACSLQFDRFELLA